MAVVVSAKLPTLVSAADVVVIANAPVPNAGLSKQDVGNIYHGKKTTQFLYVGGRSPAGTGSCSFPQPLCRAFVPVITIRRI